MMTSYLIDALILTALAAALGWGVVLARRIARLQAALLDLAPALQAFCDAVAQSERSVDEIRRETDRLQREADRGAASRTPVQPAASSDRNDLIRRFFQAARTRPEA